MVLKPVLKIINDILIFSLCVLDKSSKMSEPSHSFHFLRVAHAQYQTGSNTEDNDNVNDVTILWDVVHLSLFLVSQKVLTD